MFHNCSSVPLGKDRAKLDHFASNWLQKQTNWYINTCSRTRWRYHCGMLQAQSTHIYRVHSSVWRLPNYWSPTPSPPSECVLPPHQRQGGYSLAGGWGGVGSIFRKTPDIGLASYNIIPLRLQVLEIGNRQCRYLTAILIKKTHMHV
jgi:hypothetical protein